MKIYTKKSIKSLIYGLTILFILILLSGCDNNKNSENVGNNDKVNFSRTSINKNEIEHDGEDDGNVINNSGNDDNTTNNNENSNKTIKETELSSFSTPLKSGVANRITNIKLTCGKINEKVLQNGETFSFNQIVGPCTAEEGYKEAEIYVNKQIKFALGGGNCQVSTTLYNAALAIPRN